MGTGSTKLSAFDSAIKDAGVYNYNIIHLSSIIPPKSTLLIEKFPSYPKEYGYKLYAVLAETRSETRGNYIGAGLGWYQFKDSRGVFFEHMAEGKDKEVVEKKLTAGIYSSLKDLCESREIKFIKKKAGILTSYTTVLKQPTCVVVVAAYKTTDWVEVS